MEQYRDLLGNAVPCEKTVSKKVKPFRQVEPRHLPGCSKCHGTIITNCKLLNGAIKEYHISSETRNIHTPILFEYLGIGVVYSVNGQVRRSPIRRHFWKRKS